MPFARHFCDLQGELKKNRAGQPELPEVTPPAIDTFQLLDVADQEVWRRADLASVFNYVRRSKKLVIPKEWQDLIPKRL